MIKFSSIQRYFLVFSTLILSWGMSNRVYAQTPKPPAFRVSKTCLTECTDSTAATIFKDTITTSKATAWTWDFGDVGSGVKNTSKLKTSAHLYSSPGVKTVTLTRTVGGVVQPPIIQTVTINPPPTPFYLGNSQSQQDTTICKGDFLTLNPYKDGGASPKYKYIWYPKGDSTQTLRADTTSCYSVQVTDTTTGCSAQNKINVKLCVPPPPKPPENYWYFGNNAGIKFTNGSATADDKGKIDTKEGVSSITDKNGNLLFYTDGKRIFFKDGKEMASLTKDSLGGSSVSTQSAVIVPQPSCQGCQSIYYVFTTTEINGKKQLSYSVVDIRQNKGQGKVIEKNVVLEDEPSTEQVISHFVKKDSTYWVISHDYGTDSIRLRRVTKNGVSISKVIKIGSRIDSTFKGEGYLKVSKDGTKLAVAIPGGARNLVEVYDFADSTGAITNKKVIDLGPAPPTVYGVEFSPDSKTLFVTMKADTIKKVGSYSSLLRFDLTSGDTAIIRKSKFTLDSTKKEYYGAVQLGPDGKIYVAVQGSKFLGVIKLPNDTVSTKSLNKDYYDRNGLNLNSKTSQLGLPTTYSITSEENEGVGITAGDTCLGSPTSFQTNHLCGDKLKNNRTDWAFYRGEVPQDGKPVGSPIATFKGGDGDNGLQTSYTFKDPGKYYVVVNMGNRCKPDTMLPPQPFEVKPLPKPDLGPDINLCASSVVLDSKVKLDSTHYFWFQNRKFLPKDSLQTLTAKQSGNYVVLVENRGCVGIDSVKVTLAQAKALNLGPDTLICVGSPIVLDASNAAGTGSTYLWSTGATTAKIIVASAGNYTVTVTTPIGTTSCKTSDAIVVRVRPKPVFSVNKIPPTACNTANGEIKVVGFPAGYNFTWSQNGKTIPTTGVGDGLIGLTTGTYKVTIKSATSCDTTVSIVLNSTATPNANITPTPIPVTCVSDGSIKIVVANNSQFKPTSFVLRQKSDDALVKQGVMSSIFVKTGEYAIKGLLEGIYYLEFKNVDGCQFITNDINLTKVPRKDISLLPAPTGKCEGDKITLSPLNYTDGSIKWSTGATTLNIDVVKNGTYTVTITSTDGKCISSANTPVVFKTSPKVSITAPERLCLTSTPTTAQLAVNLNGGVWQGTNVNSTGLLSVSAVGIYAVKYELTQNGCKGQDSKEITVLDAPRFDLGPDKNLCRSSTDFIGVTPETGITYRWNTGENVSKISPARSGKYVLTATKGLCRTTDDVTVTLLPAPFVNLRDEIPLCVPSTLPARLDAGAGIGLSYLWTPGGQTTRQIAVNNIGIYSVKVTNSVGCPTTAQTKVIDRCDPSILVPDIFTPNGDGNNDTFQVFPLYISDYDLKIFNRWGELIFTSKSPEDRWDGKYKGTLVKPDSFAWVITYVPRYYPDEGLKRKEGAVTVAW